MEVATYQGVARLFQRTRATFVANFLRCSLFVV